MTKSKDASMPEESTTQNAPSQDNFLVKAEVYALLKGLTKFDSLIFKRMASASYPGARKSLSEWDSFVESYRNSGAK